MNETIIKILTELRPEFDFTENVNFIEEGMLDSFDVIKLVVALDDAFSVKINGMDILPESFTSIENIISLIEKSKKI
ncbi:MAG: acyl carrier protein [Bacteroidales bacterium]